MQRIAIPLLLVAMLIPSVSAGETTTIEVSVNQTSFDIEANATQELIVQLDATLQDDANSIDAAQLFMERADGLRQNLQVTRINDTAFEGRLSVDAPTWMTGNYTLHAQAIDNLEQIATLVFPETIELTWATPELLTFTVGDVTVNSTQAQLIGPEVFLGVGQGLMVDLAGDFNTSVLRKLDFQIGDATLSGLLGDREFDLEGAYFQEGLQQLTSRAHLRDGRTLTIVQAVTRDTEVPVLDVTIPEPLLGFVPQTISIKSLDTTTIDLDMITTVGNFSASLAPGQTVSFDLTFEQLGNDSFLLEVVDRLQNDITYTVDVLVEEPTFDGTASLSVDNPFGLKGDERTLTASVTRTDNGPELPLALYLDGERLATLNVGGLESKSTKLTVEPLVGESLHELVVRVDTDFLLQDRLEANTTLTAYLANVEYGNHTYWIGVNSAGLPARAVGMDQSVYTLRPADGDENVHLLPEGADTREHYLFDVEDVTLFWFVDEETTTIAPHDHDHEDKDTPFLGVPLILLALGAIALRRRQ